MVLEKFKQIYCSYLFAAQTNYTLTYCADHKEDVSHDKLTRELKKMNFNHQDVWEKVFSKILIKKGGYLVFDDTVLDKNHSYKIEMVRRQYSGNAHGIIKGIGVVNCVYVDAQTHEETIISYRIYDSENDAKTKIDHVKDMLHEAIENNVDFDMVLADTWYATKSLMLLIEELGKHYIMPIKSNRKIDDSNQTEKMKHVSTLNWSEAELKNGKMIHINGFPSGHRSMLYRLEVTSSRTDYIATNAKNLSQEDIKQKSAIRWKIEQFHRELKQITGIEKCQCRNASSQRNHISCAIIMLSCLKEVARNMQKTVYQLKQDLLDAYMIRELKKPSLKISFA